MPFYLIGLSGKKGSGKDTVAKLITELCPHLNPITFGFADALKLEVSIAAGVSVKYIDEHKENFRIILQGWGTDYRRKLCGETYWTDRVVKKLDSIDADGKQMLVIINDVRFINEHQLVTALGGFLFRVRRVQGFTIDKHPSECDLDAAHFDAVFDNDRTVNDLKELVNTTLIKNLIITNHA